VFNAVSGKICQIIISAVFYENKFLDSDGIDRMRIVQRESVWCELFGIQRVLPLNLSGKPERISLR